MWVDVPIPEDLLHLFAKTLSGPFDLTINHWDPAHLEIRKEARGMTRCAVAWSMWEFSPAPAAVEMLGEDGQSYLAEPKSGLEPHCENLDTMTDRLSMFDLFLGYDQVTLDCFAPYLPEHTVPAVLQGGYESGEWRPVERDWSDDADFMFGQHGALNRRKQVWLVIQAFNELKHERGREFAGAKLGIHSMTPGVFPELNKIMERQRVKVWMDAWDHQTLLDYYQACHCLLYPSMGEGKNLPALEFQSTGGVVAGTNYAGHTGWMNPEYSYPLDYELKPLLPERPDAAHCAIVSKEHLKDTMWHIYTHRAEAREKGLTASRTIPAMCDWNVVVKNLFERIRHNVPHNGELIWSMAQACRRDAAEAERKELLRMFA